MYFSRAQFVSLLNIYCFFSKEQIITFYLEDIKRFFSQSEIFQIFCRNMRILLFFFVAKILIPDKKMHDFFRKQSIQRLDEKNIYQNAYLRYFYIEFKSFIDEEVAYIEQIYDFLEKRPGRVNIPFFKRKLRNFAGEAVSKNLELFKTKRRIGEIDFHLCEIIRNDLLNDFIKFVNKGKSSHSMQKKTSIYETKPFLLTNKSHSIIEYVAFISSIQIFKYLLTCNVELHPSLWVYAIHGQNYELIHLLEEKNVPIDDATYGQVIKETQQSDEISKKKKKIYMPEGLAYTLMTIKKILTYKNSHYCI